MAVTVAPNFFNKSNNNKDSGVTIDFVNEKIVNPLDVVGDKVLKLMAIRGSSDASASLAYELIAQSRDGIRRILGQTSELSVASSSDVEPKPPSHGI